ncbi:MAG TPA: hypothetical protein VGK30_14700 [Candidatus Binatia bacterium]
MTARDCNGKRAPWRWVARWMAMAALTTLAGVPNAAARPSGGAPIDSEHIAGRPDIHKLPKPLRDRLIELAAARPHTYPPMRVFAEADSPSQLFQYYLLDSTNIEPNVFTAVIPGVNDHAIPTAANAANHQLPTIGGVRVALEPKPGLPTDPNDAGSFIDIFTDISGLFVINNESGWYEGWMIHDLVVPATAAARPDGHAAFGTITAADATALSNVGGGNNVTPHVFTIDGTAPHLPGADDHFPDMQTNVVPIFLSMGAYNCLQQSDCHSYWEFNQYTDWVYPLYETPFTGGIPGAYAAGQQYARLSLIPGSGPSGITNDKAAYGDDPNDPRDPDRGPNASPTDPDRPTTNDDDQKETRLRFIPSGLANEILLDVYERPASFEPAATDVNTRLFDAYADEVARVEQDAGGVVDGVLTFVEADLEATSDGGQSNDRLFLAAPQFNRFEVTREINDGLLAPRFAPSDRAVVLTGTLVPVSPAVPASIKRDGDDR